MVVLLLKSSVTGHIQLNAKCNVIYLTIIFIDNEYSKYR